MATLDQMVARYGKSETSRIIMMEYGQRTSAQLKGYEHLPRTEPRLIEAMRPRAGRREETAEARYYDLNRFAKTIDLSRYPQGVPEGTKVVSRVKIGPPVYQYRKHGKGRASNQYINRGPVGERSASMWAIQHGKVKYVNVGNPPDTDNAGNITWDRPRQVVGDDALERWIDTGIRRFGPNARVSVRIFGVFDWAFGQYIDSIRFPGFKEDYYVHHWTLSEMVRALKEEEADTDNQIRALPRSAKKRDRDLIRDGNPANYEAAPGYTARWATRLSVFQYIEVNHLSMWIDAR